MDGANIVVHCAAIAGIDTVIQKPPETMRVNMIGTANILEAAKDLPELERLVDFSTREVFGQAAFRAEENHVTHIGAVGEARWTYAVSKMQNKKTRILFIRISKSSFIQKDLELLKKHFNVRVVDFILSRKNLKRTLKIFEKKSIVVAGGYDKCLIYLKS